MTYSAIILLAAKKAAVSGTLLLAICTQESRLKNVVLRNDGGSPTFGICGVKLGTAQMFGFQGTSDDLMKPAINAKFAALYLKYQLNRYENNIERAIAAYNAGSFNESLVLPGRPRNLKYVKKVMALMGNIP
jgi:soluble lytic murein transglycosylase-like protein